MLVVEMDVGVHLTKTCLDPSLSVCLKQVSFLIIHFRRINLSSNNKSPIHRVSQ